MSAAVARSEAAATDTIWKAQKAKLPEDLDDDEQVRVHGEHGVSSALRGEAPIRRHRPIPPGRRGVRLVVEIEADHGGVAAEQSMRGRTSG